MTTWQGALHVLASYTPEEVLPFTGIDAPIKEFEVGGVKYQVHMNSPRYQCMVHSGLACKACGIVGTILLLEIQSARSKPHFNLYAPLDGKLLLMTADHIVPKAKGGPRHVSNLQTLCSRCNKIKGHQQISNEEVVRRRSHEAVKVAEKQERRERPKRPKNSPQLLFAVIYHETYYDAMASTFSPPEIVHGTVALYYSQNRADAGIREFVGMGAEKFRAFCKAAGTFTGTPDSVVPERFSVVPMVIQKGDTLLVAHNICNGEKP